MVVKSTQMQEIVFRLMESELMPAMAFGRNGSKILET